MPASRADLLRPLPSLTDVRNRTPAADEELRCMSNHLVNKALLRPIEPGARSSGISSVGPYATALTFFMTEQPKVRQLTRFRRVNRSSAYGKHAWPTEPRPTVR